MDQFYSRRREENYKTNRPTESRNVRKRRIGLWRREKEHEKKHGGRRYKVCLEKTGKFGVMGRGVKEKYMEGKGWEMKSRKSEGP